MTSDAAELRILGIGLVGAGFSFRSFQRGLEMRPHLIASDGGTSDAGPYFLGAGAMDAGAIRADLATLIQGARSVGAPLIVGSIGTAGGDAQVDAAVAMVKDIAKQRSLRFRLASIRCGQEKAYLQSKLSQDKIRPLGPVQPLTPEDIETSAHIVGMVGAEPFIDALDQGADVIIAGRALDPAIFVAPALRAGFDPGLAWHAARAIDKGPLATEPTHAGSCVMVQLRRDHFLISPTSSESRCTPRTVSAIGIYESDDPYVAIFPSGVLDTRDCRFEAVDARTVRVSGARYSKAAQYSIKLEGARLAGYRSIMMMGIRDPSLISELDPFLETVRRVAARNLSLRGIAPASYQVRFRVYGIDGVMGEREPLRSTRPHEVGILVEGVAATQEIASAAVRRHFSVALHAPFTGRLTTAGNIANPFSGPPIAAGPVYEWSVWHIVESDDWREMCRVELEDL